MPKQFKFTLGTKLIDQATSLTLSIFLAYEEVNDRNRKLQLVKEINHHIQALLLSYRFQLQSINKTITITHYGVMEFMLSFHFYTYITLMSIPQSKETTMNIQSPKFDVQHAIRSLELMVGDKRHLTEEDCLVSALLNEGHDLIKAEVDLEPWLARVKDINRALSLRQVGVHS